MNIMHWYALVNQPITGLLMPDNNYDNMINYWIYTTNTLYIERVSL